MLVELVKRRIFRTLALYVAGAWLVTEILIEVFDRLGAPAWVSSVVIVLFIAGFPLATLFAWMYDIDRGGIRQIATPRKGLKAPGRYHKVGCGNAQHRGAKLTQCTYALRYFGCPLRVGTRHSTAR